MIPVLAGWPIVALDGFSSLSTIECGMMHYPGVPDSLPKGSCDVVKLCDTSANDVPTVVASSGTEWHYAWYGADADDSWPNALTSSCGDVGDIMV